MNRPINLMAAVLAVVIGVAAASMDVRADALNVGFVGTGGNADPGIIAFLEGEGHIVTTLSPASGNPTATQALADASDVIVISESISSVSVSEGGSGGIFHLQDHPVRIVSWEPYMYDEAGWTGDTSFADFGNTYRPQVPAELQGPQRDIYIVNAAHPVAAGFGPGAVTVYNVDHGVNFGIPSADADVIATVDAAGNWPTIFAYEAGDQLADGSIAPGPRIGFFFAQQGDGDPIDFGMYTADALTLLATAVSPEPASLVWDGAENDWGTIDDGHSHWSSNSSDLPSLNVGVVVDAGICTVPDAYAAEAKTVDVGPEGTLKVDGTLTAGSLTTAEFSILSGSGTIAAAELMVGGTIAPGNSIGVLTLDEPAARYDLVKSAVYECEIGESNLGHPADTLVNDVIHVQAGDLALGGKLELMATSKLRGPDDDGAQWFGEQTRTIASTEGDSSVLYTFATPPTPLPEDFGTAEWGEGHIGRGVFLTRNNNGGEYDDPGVSYAPARTEVHLFQTADGDTNGDMILDERDLQAIETTGTFPHSVTGLPAGWPQGDFTGGGTCDSLDMQAIAATGLWGKDFNPDGRYYPPSPGDERGSGATVDLIVNVSTGSLTLSTDDAVLSGFVIQSREGIFGGAPASLSGRFQEDADHQIGDHLGFTLTGEHNLGNVIDTQGLAPPEFDWNRDLTFTYTMEGVPGTYTGALIVVPEPSTLALLFMGAVGLLLWRIRK